MRTVLMAGVVIASVCCDTPSTYDIDHIPLDAVAVTEDGFRVIITADEDPRYFCPGVDFKWLGNEVELSFPRARVGEQVAVSAPARTSHEQPNKSVSFIHTGHVTQDDWITVRVAHEGEAHQITAFLRTPDAHSQVDAAAPDR